MSKRTVKEPTLAVRASRTFPLLRYRPVRILTMIIGIVGMWYLAQYVGSIPTPRYIVILLGSIPIALVPSILLKRWSKRQR